MPVSQLRRITFQFPRRQPATRPFFKLLVSLLEQDPSSQNLVDKLVIFPAYPHGALPITTFELEDINFPAMMFEMDQRIVVKAGSFSIHSSLDAIRTSTLPMTSESGKRSALFPMEKFTHLLNGHLLRLDHIGVELPSNSVQAENFALLLETLGNSSNLYRSPVGDEWAFVIPSTAGEFAGEINKFEMPRSPKLELSYGYVDLPLIHFHVDTDLPKEAVEAYFPSQYGTELPGVTTYRTVFIDHPWPGLLMRFDLNYWMGGKVTEWASGEWLIKQDVRVKKAK
jgi:hypothetical protein